MSQNPSEDCFSMLSGSSNPAIFNNMLSEKQKSKKNSDSIISSSTLGTNRNFPPSDFKDARVEHTPYHSRTENSRGSFCDDGLLADFSRHAPAFVVPAVALRVRDNASSVITSCVNVDSKSSKCNARTTARGTRPRKVRWADGDDSEQLVSFAGPPDDKMLANLQHNLNASDLVREM